MPLAAFLPRGPAAEIVVGFSDVERFEAFGVDVLLRELTGLGRAGAAVRCCGVPPCVTERLDEIRIAVSSPLRDPRWAPWARRDEARNHAGGAALRRPRRGTGRPAARHDPRGGSAPRDLAREPRARPAPRPLPAAGR